MGGGDYRFASVRSRLFDFPCWSLIAVWFGVVVPLHRAGRSSSAACVRGEAKACCHRGKSGHPNSRQARSAECAICHFLATLDLTGAWGWMFRRWGWLMSSMPAPQVPVPCVFPSRRAWTADRIGSVAVHTFPFLFILLIIAAAVCAAVWLHLCDMYCALSDRVVFRFDLLANHGPGRSGGEAPRSRGRRLGREIRVVAAQGLRAVRAFSSGGGESRPGAGGDFDALDRGFITSAELAYGVTEELQIGGSIGYLSVMISAGADLEEDGSVETSTTNPDGLTDLALIGKYRLLRGRPGNLALIGGVVVPTGRSTVALENGERLSPTDQPGTGRWGVPVGSGIQVASDAAGDGGCERALHVSI